MDEGLGGSPLAETAQEGIPKRVFPVTKHIRDELEARGWTQKDLAFVMGRSPSQISNLMVGRSELSPEIAQELGVVLGGGGERWLGLDSAYRLSQTDYVDQTVVLRSQIFSYPIKEMQKRRWIAETREVTELECELKRFFGTDELDAALSLDATSELPFEASFKRTAKESQLNRAEKAWVARARQLAKVCPAATFNEQSINNLQKDLRRFAAKSQAVHRVPELLAKYGIRYVIVEPLRTVKIDGAAFWLDIKSPVIAMSLRFDYIGSFWFALMHEVDHIKHKDRFSFDDLEPNPLASGPIDETEKRANENAAEILVPQRELEAFIKAYSPRYSEARINNLATKLQIHPGIIVGQLQHRNEISYAAFRKLMAKVRHLATTIAFTDGWNQPIPQVS
jgi:HTH-type transcriptional regulator/antitoxin HigA